MLCIDNGTGRLKTFKLPRWGNPDGAEFRYVDFGEILEEEGTLWALWHLPLVFFVGNSMSEFPFVWFISIMADAFIYTWIYNSTKGSVLLVAIFHGSLNIFGMFITGVSPIAYALLNCVVAIVLITVFGKKNLSRRERVCAG